MFIFLLLVWIIINKNDNNMVNNCYNAFQNPDFLLSNFNEITAFGAG